ncbi:hypothetical protein H012_gp896 [Acanthamoeba polyphaga moumouvirus]|uniref:DUF5894 domain-containing protein n=1 Tax=Acanthamoeba polyphaga moumouvirus TaxID=1269028 RepID=L7RFK2_9VIRU|nr:hypothetical protein H012_gp896 [Acanthamoeba polyphaga moumouvirus]AGC01570.1 hypothetical protein Moumou_00022 [Acanthamoeba polyphaga moumouvirus]
MEKILEINRPKVGEVIIVNAKSNFERKILHMWAELNEYNHTRFKTDLFESTTMSRTNCKCKNKSRDCLCPFPWKYDIYNDDEYEEPYTERVNTFNAVMIGNVLPKLSKLETGKKSKPPINDNDQYLINKIPIREVIKMNLDKFTPTIVLNGKSYSRNQDKNKYDC